MIRVETYLRNRHPPTTVVVCRLPRKEEPGTSSPRDPPLLSFSPVRSPRAHLNGGDSTSHPRYDRLESLCSPVSWISSSSPVHNKNFSWVGPYQPAQGPSDLSTHGHREIHLRVLPREGGVHGTHNDWVGSAWGHRYTTDVTHAQVEMTHLIWRTNTHQQNLGHGTKPFSRWPRVTSSDRPAGPCRDVPSCTRQLTYLFLPLVWIWNSPDLPSMVGLGCSLRLGELIHSLVREGKPYKWTLLLTMSPSMNHSSSDLVSLSRYTRELPTTVVE